MKAIVSQMKTQTFTSSSSDFKIIAIVVVYNSTVVIQPNFFNFYS